MKKSEPILRRTPTNEDVPPPPRFTRRHQRKMFLAFRICARPISSKKERTFFFGVLPSKYSGRWRNNADEVLAKLFFGERICQNFGSFVFEFGCRKWKRRGLGRNFPFAPLISSVQPHTPISRMSLQLRRNGKRANTRPKLRYGTIVHRVRGQIRGDSCAAELLHYRFAD